LFSTQTNIFKPVDGLLLPFFALFADPVIDFLAVLESEETEALWTLLPLPFLALPLLLDFPADNKGVLLAGGDFDPEYSDESWPSSSEERSASFGARLAIDQKFNLCDFFAKYQEQIWTNYYIIQSWQRQCSSFSNPGRNKNHCPPIYTSDWLMYFCKPFE
jgi:hypothetical protein